MLSAGADAMRREPWPLHVGEGRERHPAGMGATEVSRFLSFLAVDRKVSASTQNHALAALLSLYGPVLGVDLPWLDDLVRAAKPQRLPVVLSRDEVRAVLLALHGTPRLMAVLLYGAGLRLLECARLGVKDVDFWAQQIVVRSGKGDRDRVSLLPDSVAPALQRHLERVRIQHEGDLRAGAGWVELPHALGRKYPNAGREWAWQWVFPATGYYKDASTGERRRHHLHETVIQRSVHLAVREPGSQSRRRATPSGMRSRRICSRMGTASGPSRSSWGIGMSGRR